MRVRCIWKKGEEAPSRYTFGRNPNASKDWYLTGGKEYVVYGLKCLEGRIWYYVVDDHDLWFPIMKPAPLFEIVDPRPSALWKVVFKYGRDWKTGEDTIETLLLAFEEWSADPEYYERLSDKSLREVEIFKQRRKKMDVEYIEDTSTSGDSPRV
jgi:hypothetical protein